MPGSDDRRRRPAAAGARREPPLTGPWPALEDEPVVGAAGWRVTRRAPADDDAGMRPRATVVAGRPEPPTLPDQFGVFVRAPRRIGAPERSRRGISLLALAAAAAVVVFVLGLAALDTGRQHWPLAERPVIGPAGAGGTGKAGQAPDEQPTERPG